MSSSHFNVSQVASGQIATCSFFFSFSLLICCFIMLECLATTGSFSFPLWNSRTVTWIRVRSLCQREGEISRYLQHCSVQANIETGPRWNKWTVYTITRCSKTAQILVQFRLEFTQSRRVRWIPEEWNRTFLKNALQGRFYFESASWIELCKCPKTIFFGYADITALNSSPDLHPDQLWGADGQSQRQ